MESAIQGLVGMLLATSLRKLDWNLEYTPETRPCEASTEGYTTRVEGAGVFLI